MKKRSDALIQKNNDVLDGYELFLSFFKEVTVSRMVEFGMTNIMMASVEIAEEEWLELITYMQFEGELPIRGYGRNAHATELFFCLYRNLFGNSFIFKDGTNNEWPNKKIQEWTNHFKEPSKKRLKEGCTPIQNFQVTHVFGKTKNPLLFLAPWNIVFLPKIMDPFTGHESKGEITTSFTSEFQSHVYKKYDYMIEDYNDFVQSSAFQKKLKAAISAVKEKYRAESFDLIQFEKDVLYEWEVIRL